MSDVLSGSDYGNLNFVINDLNDLKKVVSDSNFPHNISYYYKEDIIATIDRDLEKLEMVKKGIEERCQNG